MTCGPVSDHFLPSAGGGAKGSTLLVADSPCSMYPKPILPSGGGFFSIYAWSQSRPFSSTHIGSLVGVVGSSGRQVQPLVPFCNSFMSQFTTVEFLPTASGAADIAFLIKSSSLVAAVAPVTQAAAITAKIRRLE